MFRTKSISILIAGVRNRRSHPGLLLGHDGLVGIDGVLAAHLLRVDAGLLRRLPALLDDWLVPLGSVVERISG